MSKKTSATISLTEEELTQLRGMADETGVPIATVAKKCLLAAFEYYKLHGEVPMPPAIIRQSEARKLSESPMETIERLYSEELTNRNASRMIEKLKDMQDREETA